MFSHNGGNGAELDTLFCRVRQMAAPTRTCSPVSSIASFFCCGQSINLAFQRTLNNYIVCYRTLTVVGSTWFERISMAVILLNCVTLGMFQPCEDIVCTSLRCRVLEGFDHAIFVFFAAEMCVKVVAMGLFGKRAYLGDTWNRLDLFIVIAGYVTFSFLKSR